MKDAKPKYMRVACSAGLPAVQSQQHESSTSWHRGRYRLAPVYLRMLDELAAWMKQRDRAFAARSALHIAHLITQAKSSAPRFVLRNAQLQEQETVYLGPVGKDHAFADVKAGEQGSGETSVWEIRWSAVDRRRLTDLTDSGFGLNESQALRRSIRLYRRLAEAFREGWKCGWLDPNSGFIPAAILESELSAMLGITPSATTPVDTPVLDLTPSQIPLSELGVSEDQPYRIDSFRKDWEKPTRLVITVVAANDGFPWYATLTQAMKSALVGLREFATERGDEKPIRESYLWEDLFRWIHAGHSVIHLVPYFHTLSRRGKGLDVLPYGFHCRFGALIHEEHPIWREFPLNPMETATQSLPAKFFRQLVWSALLRKSRVRFVEGAILNDLLPDIVENFAQRHPLQDPCFAPLWATLGTTQAGPETERDALLRLLQRAWRASPVGQPGHYEAIPDLQECEQDEHGFSWQDIVLFDDHAPLNGRGAGWKKAGYRQVSITHGLPIPTGIGMSTTMRFHMDEENHGQSILNRVAPVLFKYEPKLNELGVDLDRDYLERIKHATADHKKLDELFNSQEIDVMPLYG